MSFTTDLLHAADARVMCFTTDLLHAADATDLLHAADARVMATYLSYYPSLSVPSSLILSRAVFKVGGRELGVRRPHERV